MEKLKWKVLDENGNLVAAFLLCGDAARFVATVCCWGASIQSTDGKVNYVYSKDESGEPGYSTAQCIIDTISAMQSGLFDRRVR